jgi:hypothetical protein
MGSFISCAAAHRDEDDGHSKKQHDVGDVEDPWPHFGVAPWPGKSKGQFPAGQHVQKVSDTAKHQSVPEIANRAGENERDADVEQAVGYVSSPSEDPHRYAHSDHAKCHKEPSLMRADAKDGSAIEYESEVK